MCILRTLGLILLINISGNGQNLTISQISDSIQSIMVKEDIPGVSIAIINKRDSLYWAGGYGFGDIENAKPMTAHTTMYIASVSKNFLAMAMMILVERGQVRLSDNISSIIPEVNIKNKWSDASPITVEMVLEHATGFDDTRFNNFIAPDSEYLPLLEILNKYPNALESRWQPGTLFSYSNLNYTVAGYIIEKVSDRRFEDFVQDEILNPLKMSETRVRDFTQKTKSISIPYEYNFDTHKLERFFKSGEVGKNFMQRPAGFITTSSSDMIKYLDLLLSTGSDADSVIQLSSIERMENGQTGYHSKMTMPGRYGLGNKPGLRNVRLHGHSGNAWNFADLTYNREAGIGYYVATNCSYPLPKIRRLLNEFLLQDFKSKSDLSFTKDVSLAKPFVGFYEVINSRNEHMLFFDKIRFGGELKVVDDKVLFDGGLKPREYKILSNSKPGLVSLSQQGEQFENQKYMASLSLVKDDNGDDMIIWDGGTSMHYFKRKSYLVHIFRSIGLFGSIIILLASALFFISTFVYRKIKKETTIGFEVLMSTILLIMFGAMIYIFIPNGPLELISLGEMNIKTVMFFLFSISFPLITGAFIILVIKNFKKYKLSLKCVLFFNLLAASYLCCFLYSNHFIGMQFWNY